MSQDQNQKSNGNNQNTPQPNSEDRIVTIRMKPGQGKMLIGREWLMNDGTTTKVRPRSYAEVSDTNEDYLMPREVLPNGEIGPGPTARVPLSKLKALLGSNGKPQRAIEGYPVVKQEGQSGISEFGVDVNTRNNFYCGQRAGIFDDCPFEIVPDGKAA